jgi:restriction endonuclease Mrr
LIDGPETARLMVEFEVGAEHRAMKVPTLRADAFEE